MNNAERIVVAYYRCSTEYGHLEMQQDALAPLVAKETVKIVELAETHSGRFMDGPQLRYLRDLIRSDRVSKIIVYSWDRLGRNVLEGCKLVEECMHHGTEVVSLTEPYDLRTPEGKHTFNGIMNNSEYFLRRLSVNTQRGLALAKKNGRFKGGTSGNWMSAKVRAKLPSILRKLKSGYSIKDVAKLEKCDERTIGRIVQRMDALPDVRKRTWDR